VGDDKTNRGPADRQRININESREIRYWTRALGVTEERLREIVGRVGVMSRDVRAAIKQW